MEIWRIPAFIVALSECHSHAIAYKIWQRRKTVRIVAQRSSQMKSADRNTLLASAAKASEAIVA